MSLQIKEKLEPFDIIELNLQSKQKECEPKQI